MERYPSPTTQHRRYYGTGDTRAHPADFGGSTRYDPTPPRPRRHSSLPLPPLGVNFSYEPLADFESLEMTLSALDPRPSSLLPTEYTLKWLREQSERATLQSGGKPGCPIKQSDVIVKYCDRIVANKPHDDWFDFRDQEGDRDLRRCPEWVLGNHRCPARHSDGHTRRLGVTQMEPEAEHCAHHALHVLVEGAIKELLAWTNNVSVSKVKDHHVWAFLYDKEMRRMSVSGFRIASHT